MKKLFKVLQISAMIALCLGGWWMCYILMVISIDISKDSCILGLALGTCSAIIASILPLVVYNEIRSILKRTIN